MSIRKKKRLCFLIAIVLLACSIPPAHATTINDEMFPAKVEAISYADAENHWAHPYIEMCTKIGLLNGTGKSQSGKDLFSPNEHLSRAQAVTIAVRLYQIYHGETPIQSSPSKHWYDPYREYALLNGLLKEDEDLDPQNTRYFFAELMLRVFPQEEFEAINKIDDIPDVDEATAEGIAALTLYRAGVLTGVDNTGYFNGNLSLTRAEAATIICRVVRPEMRISFSLDTSHTDTAFQKASFLSEGDYVTMFDGTYIVVNNASNQYGVYDLKGRLIVPWQHGQIISTNENVFQAITFSDDANMTGVTYYNLEGLNIGTYYRGTPFYNNLAAVQCEKGGAILLLNKDGEVVKEYKNPDQYQLTITDALSETVLSISGGERTAFLNLNTGSFNLSSYSIKGNWNDGLARVLNVENMQYGYIDTTGKEVIPCIYPAGTDFSSGCAVVVDGTTWQYGVIDVRGNVVVPFEFSSLGQYDTIGHAIGTKTIDGIQQYCLIDVNGNVEKVLPNEGDLYYKPCTPLIYRTYNSQPQLLNLDGSPLWINEHTQEIHIADNGIALIQTYELGVMQNFLYQPNENE